MLSRPLSVVCSALESRQVRPSGTRLAWGRGQALLALGSQTPWAPGLRPAIGWQPPALMSVPLQLALQQRANLDPPPGWQSKWPSLFAAGATIGWSRGPYRFCTSQRFVTRRLSNHGQQTVFSQRHYSPRSSTRPTLASTTLPPRSVIAAHKAHPARRRCSPVAPVPSRCAGAQQNAAYHCSKVASV